MFEIKGKYGKAFVHIDHIDETTMAQIHKFTNNPFFTEDMHIMPDTHAGKGAVIGFTMPLHGLSIIPNIIGVDVNCGMISIRLKDLTRKQRNGLRAENEKYMSKIDTKIRELIPMGFNIHTNNDLDSTISPERILKDVAKESKEEAIKFAHKFYNKFGIKIIDKMPDYTSDKFPKDIFKRSGVDSNRFYQSIGTLGGGNHFIEIGRDEEDSAWLTIHTGSRNFGNLVAKYWQGIAVDEAKGINGSIEDEVKKLIEKLKAKKQFDKIQKEVAKLRRGYENIKVRDADLAVLTGDNAAGYFFDMIYAGKYAEYNRKTILELITETYNWDYDYIVRSNHNFIDFNDMIIRKGAIASYKGTLMVIPFNMRDGLLIVSGKSNPAWNYSAPHGAGRVLARGVATRTLDFDQFKIDMKDVYSTSVVKSVLDESPRAYKDAKIIEKAIEPTCSIVFRVKPILNLKDKGKKRDWKKLKANKAECSHKDS